MAERTPAAMAADQVDNGLNELWLIVNAARCVADGLDPGNLAPTPHQVDQLCGHIEALCRLLGLALSLLDTLGPQAHRASGPARARPG
jgi:hypothetical protein